MSDVLKITDKAIEEFKRLRDLKDLKSGYTKAVRVYIDSGGCSGLSYGIDFDKKRDGDSQFWFCGLEIVIDEVSMVYIKGIEIDFDDDLNNYGFKIKNPNAKETCGCGTSFTT